jgi:predicted nucleotidyltransferase
MFNDRIGEPLLQTIVQRLLGAGRPQKIILFGSQARGQADRGSDFDLLIIEKNLAT